MLFPLPNSPLDQRPVHRLHTLRFPREVHVTARKCTKTSDAREDFSLASLRLACFRLQGSRTAKSDKKNARELGREKGRQCPCPLPQIARVLISLGLFYFHDVLTIWEPGIGYVRSSCETSYVGVSAGLLSTSSACSSEQAFFLIYHITRDQRCLCIGSWNTPF